MPAPRPLATLVDAALEVTVAGSFSAVGSRVRRRLDSWRPLASYDLTGKQVMVTGTTSGLGRALAEQLATMGATVHMVVRDEVRGRRVLDEIARSTGNDRLTVQVADLADLASTRRLAERFAGEHSHLDVLVHNAGAMFSERQITADGIERTIALHVVAPWLLTDRLLPLLEAAPEPARVLTMSSGGMYSEALDLATLQSPDDYRPTTAYARAKRAQVVLNAQWAQRHGDTVHFHALHPGWALTPGVEESLPAFRRVVGPLLRTPQEGSDTAAWLAADPAALACNGAFWHDRRTRRVHMLPGTSRGDVQAAALWHEVARLAEATPVEAG